MAAPHKDEVRMQPREAARRWATTWAASWPLQDVESIVERQAEDGDHWASMFRPLRGRAGLSSYLAECFAEETQAAEAWFGEPTVDGTRACVEYWVIMYINGEPITVSGCTVLTFDGHGLVKVARDYSHALPGRHQRPSQAFAD